MVTGSHHDLPTSPASLPTPLGPISIHTTTRMSLQNTNHTIPPPCLKHHESSPLLWSSNAPPTRTQMMTQPYLIPWVSFSTSAFLPFFQGMHFSPATEPSHMLFPGLECHSLHELMPLRLPQVSVQQSPTQLAPLSPRSLLLSVKALPQVITVFSG